MAKPKIVSKTRSTKDIQPVEVPRPVATAEINPINEWHFKITGRGTSGWMSWVMEDGKWIPLRASETSFISAVTAIEPEVLRLAFPHTARKGK